ncbi:MAG: tetratricopeptide repeat protein [Phycisphaerae bacterium]
MIKRTTLAILVLASLSGVAAADSITWKGMITYKPVRIQKLEKCTVSFRVLDTGVVTSKPVEEITAVEIDGKTALNQAEKLMAEKKYRQAIDQYDVARQGASREWFKRLVLHRKLQALSKTDRIYEAVQLWLELVQYNKNEPCALELSPRDMVSKGADQNGRAIRLLKSRFDRSDSERLKISVGNLLMSLYEAEGMEKEVAEMKEFLGAAATRPSGKTNGKQDKPTPRPRPVRGGVSGKIDAAARLVDQGQFRKAEQELKQLLKLNIGPLDRSETLLTLGKAQMGLAEKASGSSREQHLLEAGVNLMQVVVLHDGQGDEFEALYLAGAVNQKLGNPAGARSAWQRLSAVDSDNEFVSKARKALAKLGKE